MTTSRLLHERMREKGYSKIRLQNELGCCEKTLRNYLNKIEREKRIMFLIR